MFKDITLGQYFPGNSVIHSLDPRTKLMLMIAYIVIVFLVRSMWMFIPVAVFLAMTIVLARVPLGYVVRTLKPMRWLLILMFILNLFLIKTGEPILEVWIIKITTGGLRQSIFIIIRLVLLVTGTSLLTLTTTPISLTDGLEKLLMPLTKLKFPAHELAMMMTIALRFIPTLIEEADRIMKAQMARGADMETGSIIRRAKNMIPILIPLFVSSFRRADELAMAMESRCYHGGEGRTKMRVLKMRWRDAASAIITAALAAIIVTAQELWL